MDASRQAKIGELVDGMKSLLSKTLVAHTRFIGSAFKGDKVLRVNNSMRFREGDQIVMFDDDSVWDDSIGERRGVEFNTVASDPVETELIILKNPLGRDFDISKNARLQKAINYAVLDAKDIYYGDRESLTFNEVAICIEPETKGFEWLALEGLGSYEYRLAIMVYTKMAGSGEERDEDRSARTCHAYADAIEDLLIRNIHVDLTVEEVPIISDVCPGDSWVYIPKSQADKWQPDDCNIYEVQDNFNAIQEFSICTPDDLVSTLSSVSTCWSCDISTSSGSHISTSSDSSGTIQSSSSLSSLSSFNDSSSSSPSSISRSESSSWSSFGKSSESSTSTLGGDYYQVFLCNCVIPFHLRVADKAVLRRKARYMYDSRVESTEYGNVAKGSFILKAARLSWFGKESRKLSFAQVGLGGNAY